MKTFFSKYWSARKAKRTYSAVIFVDSLPDVPSSVANNIYIAGTPERPKWAVFDCPCLEGHTLTVNLMRTGSPRWRVDFKSGKITLSPSIVVTDHACQSHFWLQSNKVYEAYF